MKKVSTLLVLFSLCTAGLMFEVSTTNAEVFAGQLKVGSIAPEFKLFELGEKERVSLRGTLKQSPVVLVVLRGYPGYQCPLCSRQVGGLIQAQKKIAATGTKVILVYPGLGDGLEAKAEEFLKNTNFQRISSLSQIPITDSLTVTTCVGMHRVKPLILRPSSLTKAERFVSQRSVAVMATGPIPKKLLKFWKVCNHRLGLVVHKSFGKCRFREFLAGDCFELGGDLVCVNRG